jgi:hypothetical protein
MMVLCCVANTANRVVGFEGLPNPCGLTLSEHLILMDDYPFSLLPF